MGRCNQCGGSGNVNSGGSQACSSCGGGGIAGGGTCYGCGGSGRSSQLATMSCPSCNGSGSNGSSGGTTRSSSSSTENYGCINSIIVILGAAGSFQIANTTYGYSENASIGFAILGGLVCGVFAPILRFMVGLGLFALMIYILFNDR